MTDDVRYPNLRVDLVDAVDALADPGLQQRFWREGVLPTDEPQLTWDMVVHALYDDALLGEGSDHAVGTLLRDAGEAEAMDRLIDALEVVFADVGVEAPVERVLDARGWPEVVEAARAARDLLRG